jgi:hypothetical protein
LIILVLFKISSQIGVLTRKVKGMKNLLDLAQVEKYQVNPTIDAFNAISGVSKLNGIVGGDLYVGNLSVNGEMTSKAGILMDTNAGKMSIGTELLDNRISIKQNNNNLSIIKTNELEGQNFSINGDGIESNKTIELGNMEFSNGKILINNQCQFGNIKKYYVQREIAMETEIYSCNFNDAKYIKIKYVDGLDRGEAVFKWDDFGKIETNEFHGEDITISAYKYGNLIKVFAERANFSRASFEIFCIS